MKRLIIILAMVSFVFMSCASTGRFMAQPEEVTAVETLPAVTTGTEQVSATTIAPTAKPKGKKQTAIPGGQAPAETGGKNQAKQDITLNSSSNPDFVATEILGRPTDTSVTVNVVPAAAMEIYYEYGTAAGNYTSQTAKQSGAAGIALETLIDKLQPNTRYYYRIRYGSAVGVEHSFVTQRAAGSSFVFDIQGDSHPEREKNQFNPLLYNKTLQGAASDQPDFYMTIGDDFSVDTLKNVTAANVTSIYLNQRQWLGQVGAPVFLVNGNHEQAAMANLDGTANSVAVLAQNARNTYYSQPAPDSFYTGDSQKVDNIGLLRDYYAFNWGDALFVVIDPYWHSTQTVDNQFGASKGSKGNRDLWNVTLGDAQYQWFKQTLETSKAKYKFVFTHHVNGTGRGGVEVAGGYEWGDNANLAKHRPGWTKTIQQLMADNHVTIFFQGHDHIFAHQQLDGVVYQSLPEPANPFYTYENTDAYKSGDKYPNSGRVRVNVSSDGVKVDYVRSYLDKPDELAFSYTVK